MTSYEHHSLPKCSRPARRSDLAAGVEWEQAQRTGHTDGTADQNCAIPRVCQDLMDAPIGDAARRNLVGSPALAGVARHDLIGSISLARVAWKDFIAMAHVAAIRVIVTTSHAMMMIDMLVTVTVHAVAIIMISVALHVVVTAVVPSNASASSVCLCRGCGAGDQNCCPQVSQKFPVFDHCPPVIACFGIGLLRSRGGLHP